MAISKNKFESLGALFARHHELKKSEGRALPAGPTSPCLRHAVPLSSRTLSQNWNILKSHTSLTEEDQNCLADAASLECIEEYSKNIENCVGTVKLPVGVAGPLRINGFFARGDYYVPLATTEAALVASYHRGSRLISASGGCNALIHDNAVTRAPGFIFNDLNEAGRFVLWATQNFGSFQAVAGTTTRHGQLMDMRVTIEGNRVFLNLDYYTGDAAGQNMVTIATQAVVDWIREHSPVKPQRSYVEANFSGDKKASWLSFLSVRGKKVTVEAKMPSYLVKKYLHTTVEEIVKCWGIIATGGAMSGTMGTQAHLANGLAALYIATGQDAACVSESSVGVTRMELSEDGSLYAAVTMPNIIVGTVGGGTKLPSQTVGLKMLQLEGEGQAFALAEICASVCLAGELSIIGAMAADHFSAAHERLARERPLKETPQGLVSPKTHGLEMQGA